MRHTIFAFCVLFAVPAFAQSANRITPQEAVLRFTNAVRAGDVATMTAMMDREFTAFISNDSPSAMLKRVEGREALVKVAVNPNGRSLPPLAASALQDVEVQRVGPVAIVTYHVGSGNRVGRRTSVLRETESGWLIVHQHASTFVTGDPK